MEEMRDVDQSGVTIHNAQGSGMTDAGQGYDVMSTRSPAVLYTAKENLQRAVYKHHSQ